MSKYNDAWDEIFRELRVSENLSSNGYFDVNAEMIKSITGLEPRLMSKMDSRAQRPPIFKEHNVSLLAIENGTYRIAKTDPYIDIPSEIENIKPIETTFPCHIQTLKPELVRSESSALDIALLSKMTENYLEETIELTQRGRLRGDLDIEIQNVEYNVKGVQIEIDAGYESTSKFHIFEAKMGMQQSLSYRQLVYPLKMWEKTISKPCFSHVFIYDKDRYYFLPITLNPSNQFGINTEKAKVFTIHPTIKKIQLGQITINDSLINSQAPFPQADDLDKVIYILNEIAQSSEEGITKDDLFLHSTTVSTLDELACDRQYEYYLNALKWLGLIEKKSLIRLTPKAIKISELGLPQQYVEIALIISTNPIFRLKLSNKPELLSACRPYMKSKGIDSDSTINRRLTTVNSWTTTLKKYVEFN